MRVLPWAFELNAHNLEAPSLVLEYLRLYFSLLKKLLTGFDTRLSHSSPHHFYNGNVYLKQFKLESTHC